MFKIGVSISDSYLARVVLLFVKSSLRRLGKLFKNAERKRERERERAKRYARTHSEKETIIIITIITHRRQSAPLTLRANIVRRGRQVVYKNLTRLLHAIERIFRDVRFERLIVFRIDVGELGELVFHYPLDVRAREVVRLLLLLLLRCCCRCRC